MGRGRGHLAGRRASAAAGPCVADELLLIHTWMFIKTVDGLLLWHFGPASLAQTLQQHRAPQAMSRGLFALRCVEQSCNAAAFVTRRRF